MSPFGAILAAVRAKGGGKAASLSLPYYIDFSTKADGALPSPWIGSTFVISSGKLINTPTVDPTELITNGAFTAWTGDNPDGWTRSGVSAPNREITQVDPANAHGGGGIGACNIYGDSSTNIIVKQNVASATKRLRQTFSITKRTTGNMRGAFPESQFKAAGIFVVTSILPSGATQDIQFYNLAAAIDNTIDNVSVQKVNFETYFASLKLSSQYARVSMAVRMGQYIQAGAFLNMDDPTNPQNMVLAYMYDLNDGIRVVCMDRIVNGSRFNQFAVTTFSNNYVAGNKLVLERDPGTNTFRVLYWRNDGTKALMQIGTDQTIADASIIGNKYHGVLLTGPGSALNHSIDNIRVASNWYKTFFVGDSKMAGPTYGNLPTYFAVETPIMEEYPVRVATAGWAMADIEAALPAAIAAWTSVPQVVFFNVGINNCATIVGNEAAFRTSMQNCLNLIHAAAPLANIYIMSVWSRGNAAYQTTVDAVDTELATVLAANPTFCYQWADERVWMQMADDGAVMSADGKHYSVVGLTEAARLGRVATGLTQ